MGDRCGVDGIRVMVALIAWLICAIAATESSLGWMAWDRPSDGFMSATLIDFNRHWGGDACESVVVGDAHRYGCGAVCVCAVLLAWHRRACGYEGVLSALHSRSRCVHPQCGSGCRVTVLSSCC